MQCFETMGAGRKKIDQRFQRFTFGLPLELVLAATGVSVILLLGDKRHSIKTVNRTVQ
jgi:hypothetical protein